MAAVRGVHESRRKIFASVFPSSPFASERPTPVATPDPSFAGPGQPFGVLPVDTTAHAPQPAINIASERTRWNRAWHTVTTFLTLPREPIHADIGSAQIRKQWLRRVPLDVASALELLVAERALVDVLPNVAPEDSIIEWYLNEVRRHYLTFVRPGLLQEEASEHVEDVLSRLLRTLQLAQHIYLYPLIDHILPALSRSAFKGPHWQQVPPPTSHVEATFRRDLQATIVYSLPAAQISSLFGQVLIRECRIILGIAPPPSVSDDDGEKGDHIMSDVEPASADAEHTQHTGSSTQQVSYPSQDSRRSEPLEDPPHISSARHKVLHIFQTFKEVGLGQERGQRVFAEVMNKIMSEHVETAYRDQWEAPSPVPSHLNDWIENHFARLVVEVLHCLQQGSPGYDASQSTVTSLPEELVGFEDVQKWQEMGVGRLGRLRVKQLFDIVVEWDASMGAVQDLKTYITTPATRAYLTASFAGTLLQRLLHPGASTTEILQAYISLIRAFHMLDPKGVLLDRVARPIRRYLRDRDDTVKVIVAGLLSDPVEEGNAPAPSGEDVLTELAVELNRASELTAQAAEDDADLDWDDLEWAPDPIDAGPDYRKSKGSDVVGSLISLFDSKDAFVKEFQNIMGERLLRKEFNLEREVRLLELLKLRFGEGALQSCEVMLRDVRESNIMDRNIRADESLHRPDEQPPRVLGELSPVPTLHSKILSYLFWPELQEGTFRVPPEISTLQERYERGFEKLKQSRKLTWLQTLGQVKVELELEDRVVEEEVQTWQASVIYAFQDDGDDVSGHSPTTRTVSDLMARLEMDEALVRNALAFWVGRSVLREVRRDEFLVLETHDAAQTQGEQEATQAAAASTTSFIKSADQVAHEKLQVYWQFIQGMLTNGGPMPLQQIVMMLKFTVPGGFPFGEEELRQFLLNMMAQGNLEMEGERYKIKR